MGRISAVIANLSKRSKPKSNEELRFVCLSYQKSKQFVVVCDDSLSDEQSFMLIVLIHRKVFRTQRTKSMLFLFGARIIDVKRRAKILLIELSSDYTLVTHLKMTGQLVFVADKNVAHGKWKMEDSKAAAPYSNSHIPNADSTSRQASFRGRDDDPELISGSSGRAGPSFRFGGGHPNDSLVGGLPDKTTRVEITFQDGSKLFFNDQRKFGWVKLYPTLEVPNIDFMKRVGPEPLDDDFTGDVLYERLQRRKNTSIKAALLDQSVVAGIGNIYADESLWAAQIHPATLVRNIPKSIIHNLHSEIKATLLLSIQQGGSTPVNPAFVSHCCIRAIAW